MEAEKKAKLVSHTSLDWTNPNIQHTTSPTLQPLTLEQPIQPHPTSLTFGTAFQPHPTIPSLWLQSIPSQLATYAAKSTRSTANLRHDHAYIWRLLPRLREQKAKKKLLQTSPLHHPRRHLQENAMVSNPNHILRRGCIANQLPSH